RQLRRLWLALHRLVCYRPWSGGRRTHLQAGAAAAAVAGPARLNLGRVMKFKTVVAVLAALCAPVASLAADPAAVARGKYLVTIASCHDCHTPGYFLGKPDMARFLGGSEVGFDMPGLGMFHGPNLTPDKETGL